MGQQTFQGVINNLRYDLNYLDQFAGRPCYIHFEFKYETISGGIAKLKQMQDTFPPEFQPQIESLLKDYYRAHQTIL